MVVVFLVVLLFLLVFWFLLGLVWFLRFAFASLHAFVPSLTGAQRTDSSPASKKERLRCFEGGSIFGNKILVL